jgi:hyperosmotically inducible periplasmic protein
MTSSQRQDPEPNAAAPTTLGTFRALLLLTVPPYLLHPMKSYIKKAAAAGLIAAALLFSSGCSRDDGKTAGQTIDDSAITAKVKTAFAQDPGVKAMDVTVNTHLGTVQLSGWVNTAEEKARAEQLAKTVPGVKTVENKITLKTDVKKP